MWLKNGLLRSSTLYRSYQDEHEGRENEGSTMSCNSNTSERETRRVTMFDETFMTVKDIG